MNIFESLENLNVSQECFNDIIGIVEELLSENLTGKTAEKYGEGSPQHKRADQLWNQAYDQAQEYFSKKGAKHDLSTKNDLGQEKMEGNRFRELQRKRDYERELEKDDNHKNELELARVDKARDRHIGNELRKKGIKV